jgi:hypothetical protein
VVQSFAKMQKKQIEGKFWLNIPFTIKNNSPILPKCKKNK